MLEERSVFSLVEKPSSKVTLVDKVQDRFNELDVPEVLELLGLDIYDIINNHVEALTVEQLIELL